MPRTKDKLSLLLVALAIGGAWLAIHYGVQWIIALLIGAGGVFMLVSGLRMIGTRKAHVPSGGADLHPRLEHHAGFTALLWGVLYAMMSLVLFAIAYSMWGVPSGSSDVVRTVSNSTFLSGLVMIAVGAGLAMYGLTRLAARKEAFVETGASTAGRYFMGAYTCLAGAVILALGLLRAFAPELLSALGQWMRDLVKNGVQRL